MVNNAPKAPAKPVGNLATARKQQAAMRQAEAEAKQRHPAGKQAPAKPAPKKPAAKKSAEQVEKTTYEAVGRGGVRRTATSTGVLSHAVDARVAGRKAAHLAAGAVIAFYASEAAAQKAADQINAGAAGPNWTDAIVVKVTVASAKAAS
jgi:hypothetical protein